MTIRFIVHDIENRCISRLAPYISLPLMPIVNTRHFSNRACTGVTRKILFVPPDRCYQEGLLLIKMSSGGG